MFGDHGLCGLLEEGAHGKSPKCLDGNLGDFGEFCKGLTPCLYIDKPELIGAYFINISQIYSENMNSTLYATTFEENYPTKEKCIMMDSSNFPGIKLEDKQIYAIDLHPDPNKNEQLRIEPNFTGFGSTICLKKDQNGHFRVQDYIRDQCVDRVSNQSEQKSLNKNKGSWFERFIEWLTNLLS